VLDVRRYHIDLVDFFSIKRVLGCLINSHGYRRRTRDAHTLLAYLIALRAVAGVAPFAALVATVTAKLLVKVTVDGHDAEFQTAVMVDLDDDSIYELNDDDQFAEEVFLEEVDALVIPLAPVIHRQVRVVVFCVRREQVLNRRHGLVLVLRVVVVRNGLGIIIAVTTMEELDGDLDFDYDDKKQVLAKGLEALRWTSLWWKK